MYTDGSVPKDQSGWGFTVKQGSTTIHEDSACSIYGLKLDNGGGRSHPYIQWVASKGDSQITHAIILTDSNSLLQKVKNGMGSPDWNVLMVDIHLLKLLWVYCPACRSEGIRPSRQTEGKAILRSGLLLGRSKVLRSLRHYLRAQSQEHHTTDRLQE